MTREQKVSLAMSLGPLVGFALVVIALNYRIAGWKQVSSGLQSGVALFCKMLPTLVIVFVIMGQTQILVAHYSSSLKQLMGGASGMVGSSIAGIFSPGLMSALPIVRDMWEKEFPRAPLLVFLISSRLLNLQLFFMMIPLIGWRITCIQFAVGAALTVVLIPVLWLWE